MQAKIVRASWDADAKVWWARSDDIPGFVAEAESWDDLPKMTRDVARDLLPDADASVPLQVIAEQTLTLGR